MRALTIRRGRSDDAGAVLAMLDGAVAWLASTGRGGQWGTEPFSAEPERVAQVRAWAAGGGRRVAERGGEAVGAMVLGQAPPYVPPADAPEVYVLLLVASRAHAGRGVGAALLRHAHAWAARQRATRVLALAIVVLDTDAASSLFERRLPALMLQLLMGQTLVITFVTIAEAVYGSRSRRWGARRTVALEQYDQRTFAVLPTRSQHLIPVARTDSGLRLL